MMTMTTSRPAPPNTVVPMVTVRPSTDTPATLPSILEENSIKECGFLYGNLAVTDVDNRLFENALRDASRALEITRPLASTGGQRSLALGIMAVSYRELGDLDRALPAIRESRQIQERLAETNQTWQRANLALALWREGSILGEEAEVNLNRPAEARRAFEQAFSVIGELVKKDPADNTHCQLAGEVGRRFGDLLGARSRPIPCPSITSR